MSSTSTKRACDACHRRKVRCNGSHPCRNCLQASLSCTFNKPPQKKGPKGSRAKVISELRETQKLTSPTSTAFPQNAAVESPLASPTTSRNSDLLHPELIESCISSFLSLIYPTVPIIHRSQLQFHIQEFQSSMESFCLLGSLCAFMLMQPGILPPEDAESIEIPSGRCNLTQGSVLLEEVVRVRRGYSHVDNPTTATVVTTFFLGACYFQLEKHNASWFYLREAMTVAQMLEMQDESSYALGDVDGMMRRQLFWLLFSAERAYALHKHRPLTLHATIQLPYVQETSEIAAVTGLSYMVNLFRIIDDDFSSYWNKSRSGCCPNWLAQLQRQLTEALPEDMKCTDIQMADLKVTQQWLRTIVWQLATASGCLSSTSADLSMTFSYPIEIARELLSMASRIPQHCLEVHGIGLIEKLFDISCTLVDVISCVPIETASFEVEPQDYLNQLIHLISTLRGGKSRYLGLLQTKIRDTLPSVEASFSLSLMANIPNLKYESSGSSSSTPYGSPSMPIMDSLHYPTIGTKFPMSSLTGFTSTPVTMSMPPTSTITDIDPYQPHYGSPL